MNKVDLKTIVIIILSFLVIAMIFSDSSSTDEGKDYKEYLMNKNDSLQKALLEEEKIYEIENQKRDKTIDSLHVLINKQNQIISNADASIKDINAKIQQKDKKLKEYEEARKKVIEVVKNMSDEDIMKFYDNYFKKRNK